MIKNRLAFCVEEYDRNTRIDAFLNEEMDEFSRNYIQKLFDEGYIEVEGHEKIKKGYKLRGNEKIFVNIPEDEELKIDAENIKVEILYEDKDIVVLNKAAGMVVHPAPGNYTGTLVNALLYHIKDLSTINGIIRPGIVHRLDKDTSGLIVVAKNDESHRRLTEMFRDREVDKNYIAVVQGGFKDKSGRIETLIGRDSRDRKKMAVVNANGRTAITNYEVVDSKGEYSLVRLNIETGRTHQIRVHMKHIKHPIVGDEVYSSGKNDVGAHRQMLHAYRLEFLHPITSEKMSFEAELPEDFKRTLKLSGLEIVKTEE